MEHVPVERIAAFEKSWLCRARFLNHGIYCTVSDKFCWLLGMPLWLRSNTSSHWRGYVGPLSMGILPDRAKFHLLARCVRLCFRSAAQPLLPETFAVLFFCVWILSSGRVLFLQGSWWQGEVDISDIIRHAGMFNSKTTMGMRPHGCMVSMPPAYSNPDPAFLRSRPQALLLHEPTKWRRETNSLDAWGNHTWYAWSWGLLFEEMVACKASAQK